MSTFNLLFFSQNNLKLLMYAKATILNMILNFAFLSILRSSWVIARLRKIYEDMKSVR